MGTIKVYLKPYELDGTYAADYIDVTADVDRSAISNISKKIDNSDFDVGVFSYDSFSLKLNNQSGIYNDVDSIVSIFKYRRSGTLVKLAWLFGEREPICGMAIAGYDILGPEQTIFEGLLSDISSSQNIQDQKITFNVLGKESIFEQEEAPYASFVNGDTVSELIFYCLNQVNITSLLTLAIGNINPSLDAAIDDVTKFENKTVKEVLDDLLSMSNSILKIEDDIIYVVSRDETLTSQYTFYGQASADGIENIINIQNIKKGLNRTFNYWTWQDTTLVSKNTSSITNNGIRKKEISYDFITNGTTQQSILDNLKTEFGDPKREFDLTTFMGLDTLILKLLDQVSIDYPTNAVAIGDNALPIIGISKVGEFIVPFSEFSLTIATTECFKIIGININVLNETITFKIREC